MERTASAPLERALRRPAVGALVVVVTLVAACGAPSVDQRRDEVHREQASREGWAALWYPRESSDPSIPRTVHEAQEAMWLASDRLGTTRACGQARGACGCRLDDCHIECGLDHTPCVMECRQNRRCSLACRAGECWQFCRAAQACAVECEVGGCAQACADEASCSLECSGGGCTQNCTRGSRCSFTCDGGGCEQTCTEGDCTLDCSGGDCTQSCSPSSQCRTSCTGGGCRSG